MPTTMTRPPEGTQLALELAERRGSATPETTSPSHAQDARTVSRSRYPVPPSQIRDTAMATLVDVVARAAVERDALERANLLIDAVQAGEAALKQAIVDAHAAGHSWRALSARLKVPYQTLHRRYAGWDPSCQCPPAGTS